MEIELAKQSNKLAHIVLLFPIAGIVLFVIIYIIATLLYPGGSQADVHSIGFSWMHNYWCNLLNDQAMNGQPNPAKPMAITGMMVLCFALSVFWFMVPDYFIIGTVAKLTIQIAGIASMLIALFLFTSLHDVVTILASCMGVIAMTGLYIGLYKSKLYKLFGWGIFNLLLVLINNYVYYTSGMILYLPVIQKLTFASVLAFISCICIHLYQHRLLINGKVKELNSFP